MYEILFVISQSQGITKKENMIYDCIEYLNLPIKSKQIHFQLKYLLTI